MLTISTTAKLIITLIAGLSSFIVTIMFAILNVEIISFFTRLLPGHPKKVLITTNRLKFTTRQPSDKRNQPTKHPKSAWIIFWLSVALMIIFTTLTGVTVTPETTTSKNNIMSGDFRVAIANYSTGKNVPSDLGYEIAQNSYERIVKLIADYNTTDLIITVWGPNLVGEIRGKNNIERVEEAERLADEIGADVIVYGAIEQDSNYLHIIPEFYISSINFYEAEEILGQHFFGSPIDISSYDDISDRVLLTSKLTSRLTGLSKIVIGLAYYLIDDFENAKLVFISANQIVDWGEKEGKHILYLLIGNSAIKNNQLDIAEEYYGKALEIQPDYSRALLGMANVFYRKSLLPIDASANPADLDIGLIEQAVELIEKADNSMNKPVGSDISPKIHFELGQINFMLAYGGYLPDYSNATNEFFIVISDYGDGSNPRIRERAAEAHARLGLINSIQNRKDEAITEYQIAIELSRNPDRIKLFEESLHQLSGDNTN